PAPTLSTGEVRVWSERASESTPTHLWLRGVTSCRFQLKIRGLFSAVPPTVQAVAAASTSSVAEVLGSSLKLPRKEAWALMREGSEREVSVNPMVKSSC